MQQDIKSNLMVYLLELGKNVTCTVNLVAIILEIK